MFLQGYQPQTLVVMLIQGRAVEPWQVCCSWTTCRTASVVPTVTRSQSSSQSVGHVISTSTPCSSRLPYRMASMTMTTTVFCATDCQWYLWWWTHCQLQTGVCVCVCVCVIYFGTRESAMCGGIVYGSKFVVVFMKWGGAMCGTTRSNPRLYNYVHIMYAGWYWTEAHQFSWTFTLFR